MKSSDNNPQNHAASESPRIPLGQNKRDYWKEKVSAWESSELSQRNFCKQEGISYTGFCYWRLRLQKQKRTKANKLLPIQISPKQSVSTKPLSVRLLNGSTIDIPLTLSQEELKNILQLLRVIE